MEMKMENDKRNSCMNIEQRDREGEKKLKTIKPHDKYTRHESFFP